MTIHNLEVFIEGKCCILPLKSNVSGIKARVNNGRCKASFHISSFGCHRSQRQMLHLLGDLKTLRGNKLLIVVDLNQFCPTSSICWKQYNSI